MSPTYSRSPSPLATSRPFSKSSSATLTRSRSVTVSATNRTK